MRRWRVGSFSLGLTFILAGVVAAVGWWGPSTFGFVALSKVWPIILVILGLEIIVATYMGGQSDAKIRYDWLGIIAIVLVVCAGLVLEAANVTGLLEEARFSVNSKEWTNLDSPVFTIPIETSVTRAAITLDMGEVEVRTTTSDVITVQASGSVTAEFQGEAVEWINSFDVLTRQEGDTVFLTQKSPPSVTRMGRVLYSVKWLLTVPNTLNLDLSTPSQTSVIARGLKADWVIDAAIGRIQATLGSSENLDIYARTRSHADIGGNIEWSLQSGNPEGDRYPDTWTAGSARMGNGNYRLWLRGTQTIFVDAP